jgi:ribosomal protein L3 glutamine methyltransferase
LPGLPVVTEDNSIAIPHTVPAELHSLVDLVRWGATLFNRAQLHYGHGMDNAVDEALALVLHALHLPHGLDQELMTGALTAEEKQAVLSLFRRRIEQRVPVAYITHEAWFAGLKFYVDDRVLVPRSPIAELIEMGFSPWLDPDNIDHVLDLCTGSGCIAAACAHHLPAALVDATDISEDALAVAWTNINTLGVADQVQLIQSDLFDAIDRNNRYDVIVSNPPYVEQETMATLPREYAHEPALGLEAGAEGLDCVMRILRDAPDYLSEDGILIVEVGASMDNLIDACPEVPFTWLEFERGGDGIFLLTAEQCRESVDHFRQ